MLMRLIDDWSNAYANSVNIAGGDRWPAAWVEPAKLYREASQSDGRAALGIAYGSHARHRLDLFMPVEKPKGLVVFIHGGYWQWLDNSYFSHLAKGANAHGYAVAVPCYPLCPEVTVSEITLAIGKAVETAAGLVKGPIHLTGHSAGGHLAARMITSTSPLSNELRARIRHTVPISGLHDLRPLMKTNVNDALGLTMAQALAESPALLEPMAGARLTCWVGASERAEFVRQNALLANIWTGLGAETAVVEEADRHHYTVVDGLADPEHALTKTLLFA